MKKLQLILIAILCGFILLLSGFLVFSVGRNHIIIDRNATGNFKLAQELEVDFSGIESIYVDYGKNSQDVYFYEGTGDKIIIIEYFNFDYEDKHLSTLETKGNKMVLKGQRWNSGFSFFMGPSNSGYVEIYLPAGYLSDLGIVTISGDIRAQCDFIVENGFSATSTSGDISLQNVSAKRMEASAVSGWIFIDHVAGDIAATTTSGDISLGKVDGYLDASSTSGDIFIESGKGDRNVSAVSGDIKIGAIEGRFDAVTTSGTIRIEGNSGNGKASSVSGDIVISLKELTGNLDAGTVSGEVLLMLPGDKGFSLNFSSTSGECNTFFDDQLSFNKRRTTAKGDYQGGGDISITVSTTSGSLRISEN